MQLTVLGCWSPYPKAGGACSGYLVRDKNTAVLLECGHGSFSKLQNYFDFRRLDGVVISHLHADHVADLPALGHAIKGAFVQQRMSKPIPLYVPTQPEVSFSPIQKHNNAFTIHALSLEEESFTINSLEIRTRRTVHGIPAYAIAIGNKKEMVFSADTGWSSELIHFAKGATLLLCEATLVEEDKEYATTGHLTAAQAGRLAREAGVGRLVVTHLWPEYDLKVIRNESEATYGRKVEIAQEGLTYYF